MPFKVKKDDRCPASKPWSVQNLDTGKIYGCHESKSDAEDQQAALYTHVTDASAQVAIDELRHMSAMQITLAALPTPVMANTDMALSTIENVALLSVGMKFPASTGDVTFDFGDLESAVLAGNDPTLPRPRLKLGHDDPRYNDLKVYDAEPNFGFVENMRLENEGAFLYADLVDVPEWLAAVMPVAYPSRSVEGWFGFEGINGKKYKFAITAVALLGVSFPGVLNLEDLPSLYGAEMPDFVTVTDTREDV